MTRRVRSVVEQRTARVRSVQPARPVDRGTGTSGQAPREIADHKVDRTQCVSGREWMLTRNDQTLALWHLVCQAYASGQGFTRAGGVRTARPVVFDCWSAELTVEIGWP
jgi:hypothetical protein